MTISYAISPVGLRFVAVLIAVTAVSCAEVGSYFSGVTDESPDVVADLKDTVDATTDTPTDVTQSAEVESDLGGTDSTDDTEQATADVFDVSEPADVIPSDVGGDGGNSDSDDSVTPPDPDAGDVQADDDVIDCDDDNPCTEDSFDGKKCVNIYVYGICCAANPMCDDDDPCTDDICIEGFCTHENSCCEEHDDCEDTDDKCTVESCVDGKCLVTPTLETGCCEPDIYDENFDGAPLEGAIIENSDDNVGWHVSTQAESQSPPAALWYGNPVTKNFETGGVNNGTVTFPPIDLPGGVGITMSFDMYMDVEYGTLYDKFQLVVKIAGTTQGVVVVDKTKTKFYKSWFKQTINLSAFAGKQIRLIFTFDTVDDGQNTGLGVLIDNLLLVSSCQAKSCIVDSQCNDGLGATLDFCVDGYCSYKPNSNYCETSKDCDDGEPCTYNSCSQNQCYYPKMTNCCLEDSACDDGVACTLDDCVGAYKGYGGYCKNIKIPDCCTTQFDCDDGDPCTADSCPGVGEQCKHESIEDCCKLSDDCDDGDPCTEDVCVQGKCKPLTICCASTADCSDGGSICTKEECVEGVCVQTLVDTPGCCKKAELTSTFIGPSLNGWQVEFDSNPGDQVGWKPVGYKQMSPGGALHFGKGTPTGTYDTGAHVSGSVVSSVFVLPIDQMSFVSLWVFLDTEWSNGDGSLDWDHLTLSAFSTLDPKNEKVLWDSANGSPQWWSGTAQEPNQPQWTRLEKLDLTSFKGQSIRLRLRFDSLDAEANGYGGVFIDDVEVQSTCGP